MPGVFAVAAKSSFGFEVLQGFRANSAATSNKFWKLPATDGTDGQVLYTDGAGNLGWKNHGILPLATREELSGIIAVDPVVYSVFGILAIVTFVLNPPTRLDVVSEYHFSFIAGQSTDITWPIEIKWAGGIIPTIVNGVTYEVSIHNNHGICVGFA